MREPRVESLPRGVARTPELTADDLFPVVSGYRLSAAIGAMTDLRVPDALAVGAKTVDRVRRADRTLAEWTALDARAGLAISDVTQLDDVYALMTSVPTIPARR